MKKNPFSFLNLFPSSKQTEAKLDAVQKNIHDTVLLALEGNPEACALVYENYYKTSAASEQWAEMVERICGSSKKKNNLRAITLTTMADQNDADAIYDLAVALRDENDSSNRSVIDLLSTRKNLQGGISRFGYIKHWSAKYLSLAASLGNQKAILEYAEIIAGYTKGQDDDKPEIVALKSVSPGLAVNAKHKTASAGKFRMMAVLDGDAAESYRALGWLRDSLQPKPQYKEEAEAFIRLSYQTGLMKKEEDIEALYRFLVYNVSKDQDFRSRLNGELKSVPEDYRPARDFTATAEAKRQLSGHLFQQKSLGSAQTARIKPVYLERLLSGQPIKPPVAEPIKEELDVKSVEEEKVVVSFSSPVVDADIPVKPELIEEKLPVAEESVPEISSAENTISEASNTPEPLAPEAPLSSIDPADVIQKGLLISRAMGGDLKSCLELGDALYKDDKQEMTEAWKLAFQASGKFAEDAEKSKRWLNGVIIVTKARAGHDKKSADMLGRYLKLQNDKGYKESVVLASVLHTFAEQVKIPQHPEDAKDLLKMASQGHALAAWYVSKNIHANNNYEIAGNKYVDVALLKSGFKRKEIRNDLSFKLLLFAGLSGEVPEASKLLYNMLSYGSSVHNDYMMRNVMGSIDLQANEGLLKYLNFVAAKADSGFKGQEGFQVPPFISRAKNKLYLQLKLRYPNFDAPKPDRMTKVNFSPNVEHIPVEEPAVMQPLAVPAISEEERQKREVRKLELQEILEQANAFKTEACWYVYQVIESMQQDKKDEDKALWSEILSEYDENRLKTLKNRSLMLAAVNEHADALKVALSIIYDGESVEQNKDVLEVFGTGITDEEITCKDLMVIRGATILKDDRARQVVTHALQHSGDAHSKAILDALAYDEYRYDCTLRQEIAVEEAAKGEIWPCNVLFDALTSETEEAAYYLDAIENYEQKENKSLRGNIVVGAAIAGNDQALHIVCNAKFDPENFQVNIASAGAIESALKEVEEKEGKSYKERIIAGGARYRNSHACKALYGILKGPENSENILLFAAWQIEKENSEEAVKDGDIVMALLPDNESIQKDVFEAYHKLEGASENLIRILESDRDQFSLALKADLTVKRVAQGDKRAWKDIIEAVYDTKDVTDYPSLLLDRVDPAAVGEIVVNSAFSGDPDCCLMTADAIEYGERQSPDLYHEYNENIVDVLTKRNVFIDQDLADELLVCASMGGNPIACDIMMSTIGSFHSAENQKRLAFLSQNKVDINSTLKNFLKAHALKDPEIRKIWLQEKYIENKSLPFFDDLATKPAPVLIKKAKASMIDHFNTLYGGPAFH